MNYRIFLWFIVCLLISTSHAYAAEWVRGNLHEHTGYSDQWGYDSIPFTSDDCVPFDLEGHISGYEVDELATQARDLDLQYLGFSDHSYCIDATEFDNVEDDCVTVDSDENNYPGFTCLMGEELSTQDMVGDNEPQFPNPPDRSLRHCENPSTGEAHLGAYGINSIIPQSPSSVHCPTTPTAQGGINSINSLSGISILNHPQPNGGFLDFQSMFNVNSFTGIEIWNEGWNGDSNDQDARNAWVSLLQQNRRVYAYGGTDDHTGTTDVNYNFVRVNSINSSNLKSGLATGATLVSNNGYVILEAKKNTQASWTQTGGEIIASNNELLNVRLGYNVRNACTLRIYTGRIGSGETSSNQGTISGIGQINLDYPLASAGDFYYRIECLSSDGTSRIYSNPIWVTVGSGGSCTAWQGNTCGINSCGSDEVYQTRTCGGVSESRCVFSSACSGSGVTQCTPPTCPGGYNNQGTDCIVSGNFLRCTRTCLHPASCGTYGSWQSTGTTFLNWRGSSSRGVWQDGQNLFEDGDLCYQYYGTAEFDVSSWGTANSYSLQARVQRGSQTVVSNSVCTTSSSRTVSTSTYTQGRGANLNADADGLVYDYGASTCSGGAPVNDLEGRLDVDLNYRTATWTAEDYDNQICDVPYVSDTDIVGTLYNNVNAGCYVEVSGSSNSEPDRIEIKWYVNGNRVSSDSCSGSCDDSSGNTWSNTFELAPSYFSNNDEIYCTARGRGEHGGYSAYEQSETQSVINRAPTWSSIDLDVAYAREGNDIHITANDEADVDNEQLGLYCCKGSSCTPSISNFDFCLSTGNNPPYNLQCLGEGVFGEGAQYVRCSLFDGNEYSSIQTDTYIADNTAPSISASALNISNANLNDYVRTNCTVTDSSSGVGGVKIEADKPISDNQNYTASLLSGNIYYADIQLGEGGLWNFTCWANDVATNFNSRNVGVIDVQVNDPPSTPNSLTCNGSACTANSTFAETLAINCSGSIDPESDSLMYSVEGYYSGEGGDIPTWWNSNWTKRKAITILENTGRNLVNISLRLNVTYQSAMQTDFDDIRFVNQSNTELSYWIEKKTNGNHSIVWVKIPWLAASSTNLIYIYYGNATASSKSNISQAFLLGDEFNSLDSNVWNVTQGVMGNVSIQDGRLNITHSREATAASFILTKERYGNVIARGNISFCEPPNSDTGGSSNMAFVDPTGALNVHIFNYAQSLTGLTIHHIYLSSQVEKLLLAVLNGNISKVNISIPSGTFNMYEFIRNNSGSYASINDGSLTSNTQQISTQPLFFGFDNERGNCNLYVDWISLRTHIERDPSTIFGSEENLVGSAWIPLGNHSQTAIFNWNISNITPQSNVALRCRAIDYLGSNMSSSYYSPSMNLSIIEAYLRVANLKIVYINNTERVFKFVVNNTFISSLSNISWSLNTGQDVKLSQINITLASGEDASIFVYHNYTNTGSYTVTATAHFNGSSSSENLQITIV